MLRKKFLLFEMDKRQSFLKAAKSLGELHLFPNVLGEVDISRDEIRFLVRTFLN